ncbi:MAG: nucleotidyltransferase family protein [Alistipes sp.]|nr:nucleotidyltransferase family protein [Alistipes sp.]
MNTSANRQELFIDTFLFNTQSIRQGISAIVWDNILQEIYDGKIPPEHQPTKAQKIQWALAIENIIKQFNHRKQLSTEIADIWAKEGIKTYGLKGWALSTYYPKPELREFGDFDCYLGVDFERGNQVAIANGAKFNPHDYRHSHIYYKGLTIENHRYFLPVRGNARNKKLEQYLRAIISCDKRIENSNVYYPSPQFHSLFIILHMLQHFLYENITLRHMLDWAYFVNAERENIDWREFNIKCDEAGATRFVEALNYICTKHMGLNIDGTLLKADNRYADKILQDTLQQSSQKVSGIKGIWRTRFMKVQNIVAQRWKFNEIYDTNFMYSICQTAAGIVFDSNV